MKAVAFCLWALISLSSFGAAAFEQVDKQHGVVQIINISKSGSKISIGTGSGFVLNSEGYIATNHHVIGKGGIYYVNSDGATIDLPTLARNPNAKLIWASSELDLAILKVNNPQTFRPVVLAETLPRKGEAVYAVGFPGAANQNNIKGTRDIVSDATVTAGVLSRSYLGSWKKTPMRLVQHNAEISWGNSGGPLFDECRRVIGVNTRLGLRVIGKSVIVTPGTFFSSDISELMKILRSRGISFSSTSEICLSRDDQMQEMLRNAILIGVAGFVVLSVLMVFLIRKPRERVTQLVQTYSQSIRGQRGQQDQAPAPSLQPAPGGFGLTLSGYDKSGKAHTIRIEKSDLSAGVTLGREPPDRRYQILNDEISRRHVTLYVKDGLLHIRDEDSTNGTFLNGRAVRPQKTEIAANGDELAIGPVKVKILFS